MTAGSFNALRGSALSPLTLLLLLLAMLLAPLGGSEALAQPASPVISAIQVTGNSRVETDAIRIHISQPIGQPLDRTAVDRDIKAIYDMGFFARVGASLKTSNGKTALVYDVRERPLVAAVEYKGFKAVKSDSDQIVAATKVHTGSLLDPESVDATVKAIEHVYRDKGYLDAKVVADRIPRAGNTVALAFDVTEGPLVRISEIEFTGNKHYSDHRLRSVMATAPYSRLTSWLFGTGVLDHKKLSADVARINAFYYDQGYLNARVGQPVVTRRDDSLILKINVSEGPRYKFGKISFQGNLKFPEKELRKQVTSKPGEYFRGTDVQHDLLSLSDFYSDLGYAYVSVTPHTLLNSAKHTVNIIFAINPGKEVLVDRININGNTKTSDKVIRRELLIQEQEPYSAQKIRESKERLQALGFFSQTHITTSPAPQPDEINLNVNVQEKNTASFQLGGGFDSASSLFGNFALGDSNLFGGGESLMLNATVGYLFQNYSISYTEPWFLNMPLSVSLQLFDNKTFFFSFNQAAAGFSINSYYPLVDLGLKRIGPFSMRNINAGLGYSFQSIGITGLSPLTPFEISRYKGYRQLSVISPSIKRFTVDNPIDPRTGSIESVQVSLAAFGGNSNYARALLHWHWFWNFLKSPEWGSWVYSPSVTFGIGTSLQGGSAGELPLYARFFPGGLGGGGDVRGYQIFSLGPRIVSFDQLGQPINVSEVGGSKELLLSNQISFPLISALGIRGFVFTDAGNAYLLHSAMPLTSLQASYGVGIFWRSPFGPISVDIGIPINPRDSDQREIFDIGAGSL